MKPNIAMADGAKAGPGIPTWTRGAQRAVAPEKNGSPPAQVAHSARAGQSPIAAQSSAQQLAEGERWFCVRTQPRKESLAVLNLHRQGFRTFLPRLTRTVRHARKTRTVQAPLFPGYLFTPLDPDRRQWRPINGTFGVQGLIMEGERPQPVPHGIVEAILALTAQDESVDWGSRLTLGGQVRILTGPFADQLSRLQALDDHGRAMILLEIMGAERTVTLTSRSLTAAA
jgi:transcription termination/antitermination protein NusG